MCSLAITCTHAASAATVSLPGHAFNSAGGLLLLLPSQIICRQPSGLLVYRPRLCCWSDCSMTAMPCKSQCTRHTAAFSCCCLNASAICQTLGLQLQRRITDRHDSSGMALLLFRSTSPEDLQKYSAEFQHSVPGQDTAVQLELLSCASS